MKLSLPVIHALQTSRFGTSIVPNPASQSPLLPNLDGGPKYSEQIQPIPIFEASEKAVSYGVPAEEVQQDTLNWCLTVRITVGAPPQIFNAIIDINSTDLIIPSINRPRRNKPPPLHSYNSSASLTYIPNGTNVTSNPFQIKTSGSLSQDVFEISEIVVKNLLFEEATFIDTEDCWICDRIHDTFLPLGPYNATGSRNFMSPVAALIQQRILDENIFSLRLSRSHRDGPGQLVIGGRVEDSFFDGNPDEYVEIPTTDLTIDHADTETWKTLVQSLTLGDGSSIHHEFDQPTLAIFQTTLPFIGLPLSLSNHLNALIESEHWGSFSFVDCAKRPTLPNVTIVLAGRSFILTPYDYTIEQDESGRISCMSAFFPTTLDGTGVIELGSAFIKPWITVWDWERRNIKCETYISAKSEIS
ncbi:uncharacterized protein PAC_09946 [Phialocephala subalpina]|uniref:Peptidase A1 domain-containing protein n=1 Tax=Phialocephala subalpina TaxID=576137 RepID=A0A1L7X4V2_9HELO|nr:uncharacterized protein PAC_09946 [Phialocephala subalpina]